MKMKSMLCLIGIGVGATLMVQNIQNGNARRWMREMNRTKTKALEDLEDMM